MLSEGVFGLWGGAGGMFDKLREKVYSLMPPSLSPFPCVCITPWTHPSPCRWPFRAQPRRSPRIHSAFRLSATFEHPWSAHTDTRALSTPNLKWCKADIQLYIKCTNTHTRWHTSPRTYVHTSRWSGPHGQDFGLTEVRVKFANRVSTVQRTQTKHVRKILTKTNKKKNNADISLQ